MTSAETAVAATAEQKLETQATAPDCLLGYALLVLATNDTVEKARLTHEAKRRFDAKELPVAPPSQTEREYVQNNSIRDEPARPTNLKVLAPKDMPAPAKGDEAANRIRLIHSQAHIESFAIDLSWDILCRFVAAPAPGNDEFRLPPEFFADWLRVACEEARHFETWNNRLKELKSHYGALPVHNGLWQSVRPSCCAIQAIERLCCRHSTLAATCSRVSRSCTCATKRGEPLRLLYSCSLLCEQRLGSSAADGCAAL